MTIHLLSVSAGDQYFYVCGVATSIYFLYRYDCKLFMNLAQQVLFRIVLPVINGVLPYV